MHDDTQPARIFEMAQAMRQGQFPVRWVGDLGYGFGYPLFNFYAPLPYYIGALLVIAGLPLVIATKVIFGLPFLIAALTMYGLARKLWGEYGGVLSAVLYTLAPYHAVQLYVRGAVGELWAYALLPVVFMGICTTNTRKRLLGILISGLGISAIILSHNITALICGILLAIWFLIELIKTLAITKNFERPIKIAGSLLVGTALTAFFWLPALSESSLTKSYTLVTGSNDFHQHFLFIDQLWNSPWGFAGSAVGRADGMSFMAGKIHLVLVAIGLLFWIVKRKKLSGWGNSLLLGGLVVSVLMTLPISLVIWERIPGLNFIQYPWRFLVFISFFSALLGGMVIQWRPSTWYRPVVFVIAAVICVGYYSKYFQPQFLEPFSEAKYVSDTALKWDISKISDEYLPKNFPIPKSAVESAQTPIKTIGDIIITQQDITFQRKSVDLEAAEAGELVFATAYFPGWHLVVDSAEIKPLIRDGLVTVGLTPGKHAVTLFFSDTPVRQVGSIISIISITALLIVGLRLKKNMQWI
jgi:hypothetical protein